MSLLSTEHLMKVFSEGEEDEVVALDDINLNIEDEEFICLLGPSGCGKWQIRAWKKPVDLL